MNDSRGAELSRLSEARDKGVPWRKWGPYLSERQWGTVREDYSDNGDAWSYFSHDQARSRAYHWGEDGLAGLSDEKQRLCFALALWNGQDPILKERLFGLTNAEGNHGEDVKEYYFYLDSTPTHSYMKWLYKYPQRAYPYDDLVATNRGRSRAGAGVRAARHRRLRRTTATSTSSSSTPRPAPEDVLVRITAANRGPEPATLHVLPTLWFRNTWTWWPDPPKPVAARRSRRGRARGWSRPPTPSSASAGCTWKGRRRSSSPRTRPTTSASSARANAGPYVKDGINDYVVHGTSGGGEPARHRHQGGGAPSPRASKRGGSAVLRLRLTDAAPRSSKDPFAGFDETFEARRREADEFYRSITPATATEDEARVMRQALAGMLWTKQYYFFDAEQVACRSTASTPSLPRPARCATASGATWSTTTSSPCPTSGSTRGTRPGTSPSTRSRSPAVDVDFAKQQLDLMLREMYLHPSGQIPAYEWNFGDVNPPGAPLGHALPLPHGAGPARGGRRRVPQALLRQAARELHLVGEPQGPLRQERLRGRLPRPRQHRRLRPLGAAADRRPSRAGRRHGLDGALQPEHAGDRRRDRRLRRDLRGPGREVRRPHPLDRPRHEPRRTRTACGTRRTASTTTCSGSPTGARRASRCARWWVCCRCAPRRSSSPGSASGFPSVMTRIAERVRRRPELLKSLHPTGPDHRGHGDRGIIALVNPERLRRILARMLDENEFLSPYGIRALSRHHLRAPVRLPGPRRGVPRRLPARRLRLRECSAATPTGAVRSGCR